jgi:diaminopimelate epimerase
MKIEAHKLSGLGNIILIVDLVRQSGHIGKGEIIKIASERNGDFDQLITIEPPKETELGVWLSTF